MSCRDLWQQIDADTPKPTQRWLDLDASDRLLEIQLILSKSNCSGYLEVESCSNEGEIYFSPYFSSKSNDFNYFGNRTNSTDGRASIGAFGIVFNNELEFKNIIYNIRKKGIILCLKCVYENDFVNCYLFDCLIIKGQNGAGLVGNIIIDNITNDEQINIENKIEFETMIKNKYTNIEFFV